MHPISKTLKSKLIILSLVFPLSFSFIGFVVGIFLYSEWAAIVMSAAGLLIGVLLDFICYYRKLFTIALYQTPIPLTLFLITKWISNTFVNEFYSYLFALGGLLVGLWLNSELVLPFQFFKIKKRILGIIYLFFSIAILGIFKFVPAFNILLGFLAGNYLSIRVISNFREERAINKNIKQGAAFTSIVLFFITLIAGLLAVSDIDNSIDIAQQILNIPLNKQFFYILIIIGGIFIVLLQYYVTLITAKTMLQLWKHKRFSRYSKK